jgi:replicative DNA helicase
MNNKESVFVFGKLQPQAIDLEEILIGSVLLEPSVLLEINDIIQSKVFYKEENRLIFEAIEQMYIDVKPIDIITTTEFLKQNGNLKEVGGAYRITTLLDKVSSVAHVRFHAAIVYQKYVSRELIKKGTLLVEQAYEDATDSLELAEKSIIDLQNIVQDIPTDNLITDAELVDETQLFIDKVWNREIPAGLKTGIYAIDKELGGLKKGELIILAARPSMGKTTLMLQLALNLQDQNYPCAIYSYEMSKEQLMHKILSNKCEVNSENITNGNLNLPEYERLKSFRKSKTPLFISDKIITIDALFNQCIKLKGKISCLMIDYLQLITLNSEIKRGMNREQEVSYISKKLKQIAKEAVAIMRCYYLASFKRLKKGNMTTNHKKKIPLHNSNLFPL